MPAYDAPNTRMSPWQRKRIGEIGKALQDMSKDRDCSRMQVVRYLEGLVKEVTGYELAQFRVQPLCPGCLRLFTSAATMAKHYDPVTRECRDPEQVWELTLKSRGRWGWSEQAVEEFQGRQADLGKEPEPWWDKRKGSQP